MHCASIAVVCLTGLAAGFDCAAADWPQWRGPARTAHLPAGVALPVRLPAELQVLWHRDIGGGFSSPVAAGGKLAYLDAQDGQETAHLVEAATGKELWHVPFDAEFSDEWGLGPRSTPALDGDRLYVQSCRGEFRCLGLAQGETLWRTSFATNFGVPFFGQAGQSGAAQRRGHTGSAVIDRDRIVVPVGGTNGATLVCFDKLTGATLWKWGTDETAYTSPMVATLAGLRQVVMFTADALAGVELATGRLLWRVPIATTAKRHAVTPVIVGDRVLVSSFTAGWLCFEIAREGERFTARQVWANQEHRVSLATPVLVGGSLYALGSMRNWVCADAATGRVRWAQPGFAQSYVAAIAAGDRLLVLTDEGSLRLLAADPARYRELGRTQVCGETWSYPALADGRLFVRSGLTSKWKLTCYQMP